ncbi:MAG: hypothetical protein ACOC4K_05350 [Verrucomicrobiota bacterium]
MSENLMTRMLRLILFFLFVAFSTLDSAPSEAERLLPKGEEMSGVLRQEAMPELADSKLGKILDRYYRKGLGGPDNWERIESLRVSGTLTLEGGEFDFAAYQEKPDLIKMTISGNQRDLVLGYDGTTAWQSPTGDPGDAAPMDEAAARRFIHSARFGNHLLFPFQEGKTIEYADTVPVEGTICHQIRVTLDTEYQIDYFIDIRSYLEIKVLNTDLRSGMVNSIIYDDYIREYGMPISKKVRNEEDGEWVSTLEIEEVKVNSGLMPWMFSMPE